LGGKAELPQGQSWHLSLGRAEVVLWETLGHPGGLGQDMMRHISRGDGEFGWETQAVTVEVSGKVHHRFSSEGTVYWGDGT